MAFMRSEEYMGKLVMEALDKDVRLDAQIDIQYLGSKLKAYCRDTNTYLQFPRDLRRAGKRFVADVIKVGDGSRTVFFRAVKGSIRETKNGDPVA